jgi:hypothetical protein
LSWEEGSFSSASVSTFLLDSVRVVSGQFGVISGAMQRGGGIGETTSMGILFVPFLIGAGVLFFDARKKWGWVLLGLALLSIVIELLSCVRFHMETKVTHLLLILLMIAAGAGLMARGYLSRRSPTEPKTDQASS